FRNRNLDELHELVQDQVAGGDALLHDLGLGCVLREGFAQLVHGVEFGSQLGKVVVGLGKLALLDGGDGDLDLCGGTCVLTAGQLGLKGGVFACGQAGDRLVHALEHGAGANLVGQAGGRVDLFTVDRSGQVKGDEVLVGGRALDGLERAEAAAQVIQCLLDVGFAGFGGVNGDFQALVLRQFDARADVDLDLEGQLAFA